MVRKHVLVGAVAAGAGITALAMALPAAPAQIRFAQEGLARGLDRGNEPPAAAAAPPAAGAANLPYGSALVDYDGDGLLDYFSVNHGQVPHRSGLWLNGGGAGFGRNLFTVALSHWSMNRTGWIEAQPDLDGDGRPDLYFLGWNAYALSCANNGVSTQDGWTGPTFTCSDAPYALAVADVNGDGRPDIQSFDPAVPYDYYQEVTRILPTVWRINDGSRDPAGFPIARDPLALAATAEPGALLDLNRDGLPDRLEGVPAEAGARGTYGLGSLGTRVLLGQPDGGYAAAATGLEAVRDPVQKIEDVDEDGCLDVGFDPTRYRQNPYWYLQERDAQGRCLARFRSVGRRGPDLPYVPGFARYTLDVDNSGTLDKVVLVGSAYGDNEGVAPGAHVYLRQADGRYGEAAGHGIDLAETYYQMLSPGDWNNDGLVDLAGQGAPGQGGSDGGIVLFTNQTVTANRWLKVQLPTVQGPIPRPGRIEVFEAGRMGDPAALVTPPQLVRAGRHWPSLRYHFGVATATSVDVRVTFPDGSVLQQPGAATNQTIVVSAAPNSPPAAALQVSPQTADLGAGVTFDGRGSADSDGGIVSWAWDFGDGAGASGAVVTHAYAALGTYAVRLVVSDNRGATTAATGTVRVVDSSRPAALLSQATFLPQVSDNVGVTAVEWFVDGALRAAVTAPPFAFTLDLAGLPAGSHVLRARAHDGSGNFTDAANLTLQK